MSWSTLSEDLWKHTLLHVPLAQRLGSCSRVTTTLYRAAAAATQHVELYPEEANVQRLPGLCQWMLQHGQHLTILRLCAPDGHLTQLPCPNLQELYVKPMRVQLSASSTQPGVLHRCTRLTKLILISCQVSDGHSSLAALSALVRLRHLTMVAVSGPTDDGAMPTTVLQHLTQLTHLCLQPASGMLYTSPLVHVSCLANLQVLRISHSTAPLSPSTAPGLSKLTALRRVRLWRANLDPSVLQDCTQLQDLELHWVKIISAGGAAALHSLLGRLQQLQFLQLFGLEYDWRVAAAAYSSLTASNHLHTLELYIDNRPPGIWQYVFPSDRQLPALQQSTLWRHVDVPHLPPAVLGTDDISCLACCCPGLHTITIDVQPGVQLSALAKVSGLTSLSVSGLHPEVFESLRALSGLASLRQLAVHLRVVISPQNLLGLTALTGLTKLCIDPGDEPTFEGAADVDVDLTQVCHHADIQRHPPVWLQLLKHCGQFSDCQPLIFSRMGEQLAAQQQHIAQLQEQLATTREQAAAQAAAAAAAEAGELRGRLQALEGQMQQLLQAMPHREG